VTHAPTTSGSVLRGVVPYVVTATLARVADEMVGVAVVLLVIDRTRSTLLAGAVVTAYTLPSLVSGPLLGAWLDRTRHRLAALAGNEITLALVGFGLVGVAGRAPAPVLLGLAALAGISLPLTSGGFTSLLPNLVPAERLAAVTAVDAAVFNGAAVAGPGLAGATAASFGPAAAVTLLGVVATLGACCVAGIQLSRAGVEVDRRRSLLATVREGTRHLARTPPLRGATLASVVGLGALGMLTTALPARTEAIGAGPAAAGYVWAAIEIGGIGGLALLGRRLRRWRPERTVYLAVAGHGAVVLCWPAATGLPTLLPLAVLAGFVNGPNLAALFTARQRYTPADLLAQVSTTGASLKLAAFAAGSALGGQLVPMVGAPAVITIVACGQLAAASAGWLSGRPRAGSAGHGPRRADRAR